MTDQARPSTHTHEADSAISVACFPVPALLLRSHDPAVQQTIRAFADQQAEAARSLFRSLRVALRSAPTMDARVAAFVAAFEATEEWRYAVAVSSRHATGRYSPRWADRFRRPVTDDSPNLFRIGDHSRYKDGSTWDAVSRSYRGGSDTPASLTMRRFEARAAARFPQRSDVDVISNLVPLPDGGAVAGTRLLRGNAAREAAIEMSARIAARGGDTSRISTSGQLIYIASATQSERRAIFRQAMTLLAQKHATPSDALTAWLQAAYLLYQAPRRKRGADATIRTFLVAAGTHLLPEAPVLRHDIDLRAYTRTHDRFVTELRTAHGVAAVAAGERA